jgi:hypothetical protein
MADGNGWNWLVSCLDRKSSISGLFKNWVELWDKTCRIASWDDPSRNLHEKFQCRNSGGTLKMWYVPLRTPQKNGRNQCPKIPW